MHRPNIPFRIYVSLQLKLHAEATQNLKKINPLLAKLHKNSTLNLAIPDPKGYLSSAPPTSLPSQLSTFYPLPMFILSKTSPCMPAKSQDGRATSQNYVHQCLRENSAKSAAVNAFVKNVVLHKVRGMVSNLLPSMPSNGKSSWWYYLPLGIYSLKLLRILCSRWWHSSGKWLVTLMTWWSLQQAHTELPTVSICIEHQNVLSKEYLNRESCWCISYWLWGIDKPFLAPCSIQWMCWGTLGWDAACLEPWTKSFCPHCKNPFKPILQASYSSGGIGNPLHLQRSSYIVQPQWNTKGLDSAMTSLEGPEKTSWHWFHNLCACKVFGVEDARVWHYHSFRQHTSSTFLFRDMKFQLSALIWLREPRLLGFVLEEHPM